MTLSPRRLLLVAALLGGVIALVVWRLPVYSVDDAGTTARATPGANQAAGNNAVGDIRLETLDKPTAPPVSHRRNAFQFESRPEPAPTGGPQAGAGRATGPGATGPVGPPPPPPIPLRFIGYLDQVGETATQRVAVLSDGRGNVFNGREGDIIEGRYRVLRIGTDSADLIYVDGRGRQTIRLSGQ